MAHTLSNLTIPLPVWSQKSKGHSNLFQNFPYTANKITKRGIIKAIGGDGMDRGNLDHLQRVSEKQPIRRTPPQAAPIGLWNRFPTAKTVQQMMETMDRLVEDPLSFNTVTWQSPTDRYSQGRTPWEIKEGGKKYNMRFDMPGMTKEDVKIYVEEKMQLVVKADKGEEERETERGWPAVSFGRYSFRIALPENVEIEKIKAEVKDGVLYVNVPKGSVGSKVMDINVD